MSDVYVNNGKDVYLKNPLTGEKKKGRRGFSWTTLLFGFWPALFRGDWKWASIQFLIGVVGGLVTFGISQLVAGVVFGFKYNELHLRGLHEKGFGEVTQADFFAPLVIVQTQVQP